MTQAVSYRPLSAETRVRSQASLSEIRGREGGSTTGFFSSEYFDFRLLLSLQ
jgi:hypothetical protein